MRKKSRLNGGASTCSQGFYRYNTAFVASFDVKTAFDVTEPSMVSRIVTLTGVHGNVAAALLAEMQDVRGSAGSRRLSSECCLFVSS